MVTFSRFQDFHALHVPFRSTRLRGLKLYWPGYSHILVYSFLEVLVLLLQHLQSLLQVHVLFSLLKNTGEKERNIKFFKWWSIQRPSVSCLMLLCLPSGFIFWTTSSTKEVNKSRNLKPTIFSSSEIFRACWWICWFFISKTSFRLFRSSSMCLYGAKASWQRQRRWMRTTLVSFIWSLPLKKPT